MKSTGKRTRGKNESWMSVLKKLMPEFPSSRLSVDAAALRFVPGSHGTRLIGNPGMRLYRELDQIAHLVRSIEQTIFSAQKELAVPFLLSTMKSSARLNKTTGKKLKKF